MFRGTKKPLITDACKQGSEKTIYALVMDLSRAPLRQHRTSTLLPCVIRQQLMENNCIAAVVGRYFNKSQHVFLLIITQTKLGLLSDTDA